MTAFFFLPSCSQWMRSLLAGALMLLMLLCPALTTLAQASPLNAAQDNAPVSPELKQEEQTEQARQYYQLLREKAFWEGMLEESPCVIKSFFDAGGSGPQSVPSMKSEGTPRSTPQNESGAALQLPPSAPVSQEKLDALSPAQRVEYATVMLLCPLPSGLQQGTGFFVNKDHIVTNLHVVAGAYPDKIMVSAPVFGGIRLGRVVAVSDDPAFDFAVIKIALQDKDVPPALPLSTNVRRADKVGAWGYPSLVSELDPAYQKLLQGDLTAVPEVIYTEGTVSALLQTSPPSIVHSAVLSQGNSGGPLVDEKGAVVGVNTFIRMDSASNRQAQAALGSAALIDFLKRHKIAYTLTDTAPSR